MRNYYKDLALEGPSSVSKIETAFWEVIISNHPSVKDCTEEVFQRAFNAYFVLHDKRTKAVVDNFLLRGTSPIKEEEILISNKENAGREQAKIYKYYTLDEMKKLKPGYSFMDFLEGIFYGFR